MTFTLNLLLVLAAVYSGADLLNYARIRPMLIRTGYNEAVRVRTLAAVFIASLVLLAYRVLA